MKTALDGQFGGGGWMSARIVAATAARAVRAAGAIVTPSDVVCGTGSGVGITDIARPIEGTLFGVASGDTVNIGGCGCLRIPFLLRATGKSENKKQEKWQKASRVSYLH